MTTVTRFRSPHRSSNISCGPHSEGFLLETSSQSTHRRGFLVCSSAVPDRPMASLGFEHECGALKKGVPLELSSQFTYK
eukprot:3542219-Pyramimonas_sp.AAC.1